MNPSSVTPYQIVTDTYGLVVYEIFNIFCSIHHWGSNKFNSTHSSNKKISVINLSTLGFLWFTYYSCPSHAAIMKQEPHVKQADWIIAAVYCVYRSCDSYLASRGVSTTRLRSHATADCIQFPAWLLLQISLLSMCTAWWHLHVRRRSSQWQVYMVWGYGFYLLNPVMASTPPYDSSEVMILQVV